MATLIGINELKSITSVLSDKTGYPFNEMPLSFLKRRINLLFEKHKIRSLGQFIDQLDDPSFIESLMYAFPVDCTEMFRDPGFWRALNSRVLPQINKIGLPVWFPDVLSGDELFSFLILSYLHNSRTSLQIYYNHPSALKLNEIGGGQLKDKDYELNESNFKRLENNTVLSDFLKRNGNSQFIDPKLLDRTIGEKGWFLNKPQGTYSFSLVMLRNTMLFVNKSLQEKIVALVYQSLAPGGYLALGIKENLPDLFSDKLEVVDLQERIYKKPGIFNGNNL